MDLNEHLEFSADGFLPRRQAELKARCERFGEACFETTVAIPNLTQAARSDADSKN